MGNAIPRTFIIAEAGSNHQGSFAIAQKLIEIAAKAGCDAVKFQVFRGDKLYHDKKKAENTKQYELTRSWLPHLKKICDDNNIEFMATPFDEEAVKLLVDIGVKRLKVAAIEANDPDFVRMVAKANLPMIVSIGIGGRTIGSIIRNIREANNQFVNKTVFLHCITSYPTKISDIRLSQLMEYNDYYRIGLSDHTKGILIPPIAVALGARYIEKHFTFDRNADGPDHKFALEPVELEQMVKDIRLVESAMGVREKDILDCELPSQENMRFNGKRGNPDVTTNEKTKTDLIIDSIQSMRSENNVNWMDLVRLAFKSNPDEARSIMEKIVEEDGKIRSATKELCGDKTK